MGKRVLIQTILFGGIFLFSLLGIYILVSENPLRLHNNRYFTYLKDECISLLKSHNNIGEKHNRDYPDRKEIGPLPDGSFITSYHQEGTDIYYKPYNYKYTSTDPYTAIESYYDYYGIRRYRYTTKYEKRIHWATEYKEVSYPYSIDLSIYDISDQLSISEKQDSTYQRLMNAFESLILDYEHWRFDPLKYKDYAWQRNYGDFYKNRIEALSYVTNSQDGIKTLRSIYFANRKAYVLEVRSNYHTAEIANKYLANLTTLDLLGYNYKIMAKIAFAFFIAAFLIFVFIYNRICMFRRVPIKNNSARRMLRYALCMTVLNILILSIMLIRLFFNYDLYESRENNYEELIVSVYLMTSTLLLMNLLTCTYLYIKSKKEYQYDYLIQKQLQAYFSSRLDNQQEKKTLVSFLYYPLFVLGVIPFGILILLYAIPFALITYIALEIRYLYRWINKGTVSTVSPKESFLDYYVALNLRIDANKEEIEKAFNSAMAKYNSANGNPLYGKQFYYEIQEAYAILGSTNQLRPEYDKEYKAYKGSNSTSYSYSNKQLENEILNIRNKLYKNKSKGDDRAINIIVVSFVLFFVLAFVLLRLTEVIPPLWESN